MRSRLIRRGDRTPASEGDGASSDASGSASSGASGNASGGASRGRPARRRVAGRLAGRLLAVALAALALGPPHEASAQGFLDNGATASGSTNGVIVRSEDDARVTLASPSRAVLATCVATLADEDAVPGMSAGDEIALRISLANPGEAALSGVRVDAGVAVNLPLVIGDDGNRMLGLDETWVYRASVPIAQGDLDTNGNGTGLLRVPGTATADRTPTANFTCELPIDRRPALALDKVADAGPLAGTPPRVGFTITARNTGNVTLRDVAVTDPLLTPPTTICPVIAVGAACERTALYAPTEADIAAGRVVNVATAMTTDLTGEALTASGGASVELTGIGALRIAKSVSPVRARRGDTVTFTVSIANSGRFQRGRLRVVDRLPPGLAFREGSLRVDGLRVPGEVRGATVSVGPLRVPARETAVVTFQAGVTAAATPGGLVNRVELIDAADGRLIDVATAEVELAAEPVFDCADVLGRVFEDRNRNGVQDDGEPGLPGARVATVRGLLVTADEFGRFSIPCVALPARATGENFILKLDEDSLPRGTLVVTENPRVVRLTPGRIARVNFGVARLRAIEVQVTADAFLAGRANLDPSFRARLDQLIGVLRDEPGILRLTYRGPRSERALAAERLRALGTAVEVLWTRAGEPYELEIEQRVIGE